MGIWKFLWNVLTGKASEGIPGNSDYDDQSDTAQYASGLTGITPPPKDEVPVTGDDKSIWDAMKETGHGFSESSFGSFLKSLGQLVPALVNRISATQLTGAEREANAFSAEQAQMDRDFQERMANSQYQRGVADMRAAGVNPALAIGQGGAAAPSGQAASSTQPQGSAFNLGDIFQLMMIKPQMELLRQQSDAVRKQSDASLMQGQAALENAQSNTRNASTNEKDAETRRRSQIVDALLANNQIKVGDSIRQLNSKQMEKIAQDIRESASRIDLQAVEKLAKELQYQFDYDTFETNKELVLQQLVYRAVEMSEMRSVISLNASLKKKVDAEGEILDAEAVGEKLSAEWKKQNPHTFKILEAAGMATSVIGNVLSGSFGWSRSKSRSSSDVKVDSRSRSVSDVTTHKGS